MKETENTHVVYDGRKIIISSNLVDVFNFLSEIGKEVDTLLGFKNRLNKIYNGYEKLVNLTKSLLIIVEDNKLDFTTNLTMKDLEKPLSEFKKYQSPIRSMMIVLFSYIEVLFCINLAYKNQTSEENEIIGLAMKEKNVKKFLNNYFLNDINNYYKENREKFSKISAKLLRDLRNLLVHFFSTNVEISIIPKHLASKARKLEQALENDGQKNMIFISPDDLYCLIKDSSFLILKEWTKDSNENPLKFKKKINCVKKLIINIGPVIVPDKDIKIN